MEAFLPNFREPVPESARESSDSSAAIATEVKPADAAPLAEGPAQALNAELKAYLDERVVESVSQAIATVLPEVVKSTLAQQQSVSVPPAAPVQPVREPDDEGFDPGRYQGRRLTEARQDLVAWCSVGVIVAVMGGVVAYAMTLAAPAQTQRQNRQLTDQLTQQSQRLLESNQQILESKQRCGDFSFICNIKE